MKGSEIWGESAVAKQQWAQQEGGPWITFFFFLAINCILRRPCKQMCLYKRTLNMEASPLSSILEFHVTRKSKAGFGQFTPQARVPVGGFNWPSAAPPAIAPSGWAPWGSPGLS